MIASTGIASGHVLLADWLFLLAAVLFGLDGLIVATGVPDRGKGTLMPAAFALLAIGWVVL